MSFAKVDLGTVTVRKYGRFTPPAYEVADNEDPSPLVTVQYWGPDGLRENLVRTSVVGRHLMKITASDRSGNVTVGTFNVDVTRK